MMSCATGRRRIPGLIPGPILTLLMYVVFWSKSLSDAFLSKEAYPIYQNKMELNYRKIKQIGSSFTFRLILGNLF